MENQIRECALRCISGSQNNCSIHDDNVSYQYTVAFNDGVIALMKSIISELHKEEVVIDERAGKSSSTL